MIMLFLHGIAQGGRSSAILRKEWLEALNLGHEHARRPTYKPATRQLIVPYYGKILAASKSDRKRRSAKEQQTDLTSFAMEFGEEALGCNAIRSVDETLTPPDRQRRDIQNWTPVLKLTKMIDDAFPDISAKFVDRFLKEVHAYLCDDATRDAVNKTVLDSIKDIDDDLIIVSHSLGTVVAFELLCSLGRKISVRQLITLGSPLAIKAVKSRLRAPPCKPAGVSKWFNGFDAKDIVALNPLDARNFVRAIPAIINHSKIHNFTENHHSIAGYLADAKVAELIFRSLR